VLDWPAHRRTQLQCRDAACDTWELIGEHVFELLLQAVACGHVLGDDDGLAEEIVRQLHAEWQIKPDRTAAYIGTPARDIRIVLKHIVDTARHRLASKDRGILWERQVDEQFRPVGRRKELVGNEADREYRSDENRKREGDRQPLVTQCPGEERAVSTKYPARLARHFSFWRFQNCHAQQGCEQNRDKPRCNQRDGDYGKKRKRIFTGTACGE